MRSRLIIAVAPLLLAAVTASAQDVPGDLQAGQDLALTICAACHDVGGQPPEGLFFKGDPPPFRLVADDPAVTALSLRVFLRTPRRNMPNIMLSQQETDNVIVFILSLRNP